VRAAFRRLPPTLPGNQRNASHRLAAASLEKCRLVRTNRQLIDNYGDPIRANMATRTMDVVDIAPLVKNVGKTLLR
jgi:hypothetical protein